MINKKLLCIVIFLFFAAFGCEDALKLPGTSTNKKDAVKAEPCTLTFHLVSDPDPARDDLAHGPLPGINQEIFYVKAPLLTNVDIQGAESKPSVMGGEKYHVIMVNFTKEGTKKFAQITTDYVGSQIAIVADGKILSCPTVQEPVTDGKCQITGNFSPEEAAHLAAQINAGSATPTN